MKHVNILSLRQLLLPNTGCKLCKGQRSLQPQLVAHLALQRCAQSMYRCCDDITCSFKHPNLKCIPGHPRKNASDSARIHWMLQPVMAGYSCPIMETMTKFCYGELLQPLSAQQELDPSPGSQGAAAPGCSSPALRAPGP